MKKTFGEHKKREIEMITKWSDFNKIKIRSYTEEFQCYDFTFEFEKYGTIGICEAKIRNKNFEDYKERGVIIEMQKLFNVMKETGLLQSKYLNFHFQPYYLHIYKDKTFLFNLNELKYPIIETKNLPKYEAKYMSNQYEFKPILYLNEKDSILTNNTIDFS